LASGKLFMFSNILGRCLSCGVEEHATDGLFNCEGEVASFGRGKFPSWIADEFTGLDDCKYSWHNRSQWTSCKGGTVLFGIRNFDGSENCEEGTRRGCARNAAKGFLRYAGSLRFFKKVIVCFKSGRLCLSCSSVNQVVWP
jgi:hypothetical protein